jgi:hypothetical protein
LFVRIVAFVLVSTAVLKLWSVRSEARILNAGDPIFDIPNRYVMWVAAIVELWVSFMILTTRNSALKLKIIASLGAVFATYRTALSLVGFHGYCACLGQLGENIPIRPETLSALLWAFVAFMLIGSVSLLFFLRESPPSGR